MAGKPVEHWDIVVIPDGTPEEAEAAARRARRMVVQWILRNEKLRQENSGGRGGAAHVKAEVAGKS